MARRNMTNEMKVGALVVLCIIVLIGFLYKTGLTGLLQDEAAGKIKTEGYFFSFAVMF